MVNFGMERAFTRPLSYVVLLDIVVSFHSPPGAHEEGNSSPIYRIFRSSE